MSLGDVLMDAVGAADAPRRVRFEGLTSEAFQHPLDRLATDNLKKVRGFDWLVRKFLEYGFERIEYVQNIGGAIRVGPQQLPQIYALLQEACQILDVPEPELYLRTGPVGAITSGHDHPAIVLYTDLVDRMTDAELMGIIAHELGHIKCGHVLYKVMARAIKPLFQMIGQATLGAGRLIGVGLEVALRTWDQRSELSADRATLLALQDATPSISMLMKLAGGSERTASQLSVEQFLNQARAYREGLDDTLTSRLYRFLGEFGNTHPFLVERARELDSWVGSDQYKALLAQEFTQAADTPKIAVCPTCHQPVDPGLKFCPHCGTPNNAF
jgi:Zn-dependent protease with chaperone function